ncbi:MAG: hypothetical protein ACYTJ0_01755 [Planctomycetota bacterium]|jgi:hypothetical protein
MNAQQWLRAAALSSATLALSSVASAQEQPSGCDATAVGVRLVATVNLSPIPPDTCVLPGQSIIYRTAPFVPLNPLFPACGVIYCDITAGQLSVTFPNWEAALPPGALRPDQFAPVAGYAGLPDVTPFGNGDPSNLGCGAGIAADPLPLFTAPTAYLVDASHADGDGFLRARADYGQTSFLNLVGLFQQNGQVLSGDPDVATASVTSSLPLCVPSIELEKIADVDTVCAGQPTLVTYTFEVRNTSTSADGLPPVDLTNVLLEDELCGPISGPIGDDGDGLLEPDELWVYTCEALVDATTTNTATVSAEAVAMFPPGQVVAGVLYTDTATATVTAVGAECVVDGPATVCIGGAATYCGPEGQTSYQWSVAGSCSIAGADDGQCADVQLGDAGACAVSLAIESPEGCSATCNLDVAVVDCNAPGGCSEKGSLLVFSKIELRWNTAGNVVQDTFVSIINDYPEDVHVQMYFVNGDPPTALDPGWNWVDNGIELTGNEPAYWSALTGQPKGVSPFTVLDADGRPCPDGSGDFCLRGYILAWAVNAAGEEIKWNHLAGTATLVNYRDSYAWEYNACAFAAADQALPNGAELGTPGVLMLDGTEFASVPDLLLMDFYAAGSTPFAAGGAPADIVAQTDLTLHPADADLRQETEGPVTTKASFSIWNENEVKFSGTDRCITCWDQTLLRDYDLPNHFLRENLQTDKGRARIDGLESQLCPDSQEAALLGVIARFLSFDGDTSFAASGTNLHGAGIQGAAIRYDTGGVPPEATDPTGGLLDRMLRDVRRAIGRSRADDR